LRERGGGKEERGREREREREFNSEHFHFTINPLATRYQNYLSFPRHGSLRSVQLSPTPQ